MITLAGLIAWLPGAVGAYGVTQTAAGSRFPFQPLCRTAHFENALRPIMSGYSEGKGESD
jgi:hypothetical protein